MPSHTAPSFLWKDAEMTIELPKQLTGADLDIPHLDRLFDQTKATVFLGKNASFFGSLLCSFNFYWTADIETAAISPHILMWNPYWFLKLNPSQRRTILMHELWHPARLHHIRRGERNPIIWNVANDHRINNDLLREGYDFKGLQPCLDLRYKDMVEEDIYDDLCDRNGLLYDSWTGKLLDATKEPTLQNQGDMLDDPDEPDPTTAQTEAVGKVVQAKQVAELSGETVDLSGTVETLLKQFLAPLVPWHQVLAKWMQDLSMTRRSFRRPNRRYPGLYLPSTYEAKNALSHLAYFIDVSASMSDAEIIRVNSEIRYLKDKFNPKQMTLIQFDTKITKITEFTEKDKFEELVILGRGGTSFICVREWIQENQPTAAIIFSDMGTEPMERLAKPIPVLWIAINNHGHQVPFGQIIHIRG